jgi:cellulose synthase (UDP-forming)
MVAGLAPETFTGFVIQRMRWAQGMVQILLLKKPFMMPGLRWHQRIGYMSSMVFWLFPFARLIFLFAPLAYLVFGLEVYNASIAEIAVYTVPNVIATYLLSNLLFGKTRWPLISGLYEIMQCVFSFRAIIDVLRNPKSPKFVVTPKSETLEAEFISPLAKPFYYILFCLFLGIIGCIYRVWIYPLTRQLTIFVGLWNILNFFVVFVSLGALIERRQRRTSPRMPADEEGVIASTDVAPLTCEIDDLSAHGARACIDPEHVAPAVGSLIDLFVESRPLEREVHLSCRVRSVFAARGKTCIGLQFEPIDERMTTDAVLLAFGDSERWIRFQRRRLRKISYRLALRMILDLAWQPVRAHFVLLWKKKFSFLARRQAEI